MSWKAQAKAKAEQADAEKAAECMYSDPVPPNPKQLDGVPDMSALLYLEENHIVYNVMVRYKKDQIYTNISNILVAINPYKQLEGVYGNSIIEKYHAAATRGNINTMGPHPYGAAEASYRSMCRQETNQSLIVCGESGAGKTESAKTIMTHLTYITASHTQSESSDGPADGPPLKMPIEQQILAANPILEAFGNARTVLNNNSSRFGKFTKLLFHEVTRKGGTIVGSFIETYLLEKSRVTRQTEGERNFHVFYQLFESDKKAEYDLTEPSKFHYTNQSSIQKVNGINDAGRFQELKSAMSMLQIPDSSSVLKIVAAILHIGNVTFKSGGKPADDCELDTAVSTPHIEKAASLINLTTDALTKRLTSRSLTIRGETTVKPLSTEDAILNRDAISKVMYSKLFDWIVEEINRELYDAEDDTDDVLWIGILDVFGFECFDTNSFEQFCINFANERLQNYFNVHVVKSEQEEYTIEAIFWTPVNVPDNQEMIDLIDSRPVGLLALLDGACSMPRADDKTFTANLFEQWPDHPGLQKERYPNNKPETRKAASKSRELFNGFSIHHFAGRITYDAAKFLIKNADAVHPDTTAMLGSSGTDIIKAMFPVEEDNGGGSRGKKSKVSVGKFFSRQLETLMTNLAGTQPYFIRCVNPNNKKKPGAFDPSYVLMQLRNGGLVEALRILKCGYPSRTTYDSLHSRYGSCLESLPKNMNKRDFCEAILAAFELSKQEYQLGLSKVFFRPNQGEFLEMIMREESVTDEIKRKIKDHIVKKRVIRFGGFVSLYARLHKKLKSIRNLQRWFKIAGLVHRYNMHFRRRLYAIRRKRAVGTVQAVVRMVAQSQRLSRESGAANVLQTTWRHSYRRRRIAAAIEVRCAKKRDEAAAAAAKAKREQEEREMQERAQKAAAERQRIADEKKAAEEALRNKEMDRLHGDFVSDAAFEIAAWFARVIGEEKPVNLYIRIQDGVLLCQLLEKISAELAVKYHTKAPPGSFYARDNIKKFLKSATKSMCLEKELLFSNKDLTEMEENKTSAKNVINGLFNIALKATQAYEIEPCEHVELALGCSEEWEDDDTGIRFFGDDDDDDTDCWRYLERPESDAEEDEKGLTKLQLAARKRKQAKGGARGSTSRGGRRKSVLATKKEARARAETKTGGDDEGEKRDALEEFFCMTTAAVLRKLQETGKLEDFKWADFSAKRLYKQAVIQNCPWHMWHDWIRNRVLAKSSDATGDGDAVAEGDEEEGETDDDEEGDTDDDEEGDTDDEEEGDAEEDEEKAE